MTRWHIGLAAVIALSALALVALSDEASDVPPAEAGQQTLLWGDLNCDGDVDGGDAVNGLRILAALSADQVQPCPSINGHEAQVPGASAFGDIDCGGSLDPLDILQLLAFVAHLPLSQSPGCPAIGADSGIDPPDATASPTSGGPTPTTTATSSTTPTTSTATQPPTPTPTPTATPTASPTLTPVSTASAPPLTRVVWQGQPWYLHGANLPWYNWGCDFGCGANNGVVDKADVISARLQGAEDAGMNVIRWWVFPGDPYQLDDIADTYPDFDAAIDLAEEHDLYYNFVLFSSPLDTDDRTAQQLATALTPLFQRYANEPRVMAWEVFNEPEWHMWSGAADEDLTIAQVDAVVDAVHASGPQLTTVGSAHLDGLGYWTDSGLDFYQAHWYDYMDSGGWCAICTTFQAQVTRFGLDAPLVIGEFYASDEVDAEQRFEDWRAKGYAGGWPWSLFPERTFDELEIDMDAAAAFDYPDNGP